MWRRDMRPSLLDLALSNVRVSQRLSGFFILPASLILCCLPSSLSAFSLTLGGQRQNTRSNTQTQPQPAAI
ncbi:hypothetical protein BDZ89DRAFT_1059627 [Hymenopellis radicata]|nr:hypothetical protein BDZ89DRAFT_1059627 [Hymenopellis radicata]